MAKQKWIKQSDFTHKYDLHKDLISVKKSTNYFPKEAIRGRHKWTEIDENFFLRRREFRRKVWLQSHENYYFLSSVYNDSEISRMLVVIFPNTNIPQWINFMGNRMFTLDNNSMLNYKVPDKTWKFWRATTLLIQRVFRKVGVPKNKRDLSVLIEKN